MSAKLKKKMLVQAVPNRTAIILTIGLQASLLSVLLGHQSIFFFSFLFFPFFFFFFGTGGGGRQKGAFCLTLFYSASRTLIYSVLVSVLF